MTGRAGCSGGATTSIEARRDDQLRLARQQWSAAEPSWGVFGVPETVARLLPAHADGTDVVELGCGTAYVSAWLARRGAHPVGVDPTPGQLRIARQFQDEFDLPFPLVRAGGRGRAITGGVVRPCHQRIRRRHLADPYRWIPEAARLLRPGTVGVPRQQHPADDVRPRHRRPPRRGPPRPRPLRDVSLRVARRPHGQFHLGHGDWIRLLRANGFDIEDLIELRAPPDATSQYSFVTADWARRWPSEEAWKARRR